jgi:hypothetical protein
MGLIPMIVLKLIEILQKFSRIRSRLGKGLEIFIKSDYLSIDCSPVEADLSMVRKRITMDSSFREKVGFRNIMKENWKSTSGSPSFFLPCQVPSSLSFSLSHLEFLSFLN